MSAAWEIRQGDATERLRAMPDESVQCCVTSPPFFGLRDYGVDGQIGLEATPDEFVARLVGVFREVRRVLRSDGTLWLNVGDSYSGGHSGQSALAELGERFAGGGHKDAAAKRTRSAVAGAKPKDLLGIPWLLAFALRADGWYLRSDVIWAKPNPMPESVTDRPTSAHEHVFLLSRSPRYFYDADAIREANDHPDRTGTNPRLAISTQPGNTFQIRNGERSGIDSNPAGRNKRNVWEIATQPYPDAHFATFPPKLVEPCILAGSSPKVCGECGAPWERVVERYDTGRRQKMADGWDTGDGGHGTIHRNGREAGETGVAVMGTRTIGWQPSCAHQDDDTAHSVILDPFAGAGTTGLVALRHDRSFIGIELSPAYAEMARERIRSDAPLLNTVAEV